MKKPTINLLSISIALIVAGCTGRQNPGHYDKIDKDRSWTGNPVKTNAAAEVERAWSNTTPIKTNASAPLPSLNMTEKMASARARSLVVLPKPHTNGLMQLECDLPPDAAAVTLIAMVGTSPDVFKEWMRFSIYDNWTLKGLDETVTNYTYVMAATAWGANSPPSNVLAFLPRTNLLGHAPNITSHSMRLTWSNTSPTAIERTTRFPATWTRVAIVTNTGSASLVVTNPGPTAFYRANASRLPRPMLQIEEWQKLIGWTSGTLRRLVDSSTGSWTNVATGGGTIISSVGETYRVLP